MPALHEVHSLETETLRSQLRLAPAAAVLVPERNCKRVRSSEISCFRTGQLLRLCGSDSTLRPKPASGSQALSGVRAVAACLGGSCLVRHRHGYTSLALVPALHPTFLCSNAQPSCVSPHHKSSHCHILWPHIDCTLRCGCHCAKSMYHTCVSAISVVLVVLHGRHCSGSTIQDHLLQVGSAVPLMRPSLSTPRPRQQ